MLSVASLSGCKASLSADLDASAKANRDKEPPPPPPSSDSVGLRPKTAFVGVTQALSLSDEASAKAACRCLAAAVGSPRDASFQWRGTAPTVGDDALVVAIASGERTPCEGATGARRPSIQGVEAEGNNIIVTLEEPRPGVPEAHGAVIQRPTYDGGHVIFRSSRRLPYGQPLAASSTASCQIPIAGGTAPAASRTHDAAPATTRRSFSTPVNTY